MSSLYQLYIHYLTPTPTIPTRPLTLPKITFYSITPINPLLTSPSHQHPLAHYPITLLTPHIKPHNPPSLDEELFGNSIMHSNVLHDLSAETSPIKSITFSPSQVCKNTPSHFIPT